MSWIRPPKGIPERFRGSTSWSPSSSSSRFTSEGGCDSVHYIKKPLVSQLNERPHESTAETNGTICNVPKCKRAHGSCYEINQYMGMFSTIKWIITSIWKCECCLVSFLVHDSKLKIFCVADKTRQSGTTSRLSGDADHHVSTFPDILKTEQLID